MKKHYLVPVTIEPLEEGGYLAVCPVIQGCHAEGLSVAEAIENVENVARVLLELQIEDGLGVPEGLREAQPDSCQLQAQILVGIG